MLISEDIYTMISHLTELRIGAEDERAVNRPQSLLKARDDFCSVEHFERLEGVDLGFRQRWIKDNVTVLHNKHK